MGGIEKGEEARPETSAGAMQFHHHCFGGVIYDELKKISVNGNYYFYLRLSA